MNNQFEQFEINQAINDLKEKNFVEPAKNVYMWYKMLKDSNLGRFTEFVELNKVRSVLPYEVKIPDEFFKEYNLQGSFPRSFTYTVNTKNGKKFDVDICLTDLKTNKISAWKIKNNQFNNLIEAGSNIAKKINESGNCSINDLIELLKDMTTID